MADDRTTFTTRIPNHIYNRIREAVHKRQAKSINDWLVDAAERKLLRPNENIPAKRVLRYPYRDRRLHDILEWLLTQGRPEVADIAVKGVELMAELGAAPKGSFRVETENQSDERPDHGPRDTTDSSPEGVGGKGARPRGRGRH